MSGRRAVGDRGEQAVADHLASRGWTVLSRNWRIPGGELDLVSRTPDGTLSFLEVKTALGDGAGDPSGWIPPRRRARIANLAEAWRAQHDLADAPGRFDAALVRLRDGRLEVEILEDAFSPWDL